MFKRVILLLLLVLPICFAKEVNIIETFESEKNIGETTYYYAGSKLIATKNNNEVNYQYQDRLGSDVESNSLPFGEELKSSERFSFTGKELDSELYYFNARYYDSKIGRFTSVDPVAGNNPYAYVENNPMNFVDPDGMIAEQTAQLMLNAQEQGRFEEYEQIQKAAGIEGLKILGDYAAGELSLGLSDLGQAIVGQDLYGQEVGTFGRVLMLAGAAPLVPSVGSAARLTMKRAEEMLDAGAVLRYNSLPTEMRRNLASWEILEDEVKKSDIQIKLLGSTMEDYPRVMANLDAAGIDRGTIRRIGGETPSQGILSVQGGKFVTNQGGEHKWLNKHGQVVSSIPMHDKTIAPGTAKSIKLSLKSWAYDSYHSSYTPEGTISIERQFLMTRKPNNVR